MSFFGRNLRTEIFGESHGDRIGVAVEGLGKGFVDIQKLRDFCALRAPDGSGLTTLRSEKDEIVFDSGIDGNGYLTGERFSAHINNTDVVPYKNRTVPRPGHADYPAFEKLGYIPSGGGAFSGRMTAPLCIAGGIAMQLLEQKGIFIDGHISSLHGVLDVGFDKAEGKTEEIYKREFPVIDAVAGEKMKKEILKAKEQGDSVGGTVECTVTGIPVGTGGELFSGLDGRISSAVFAVPGVKGIEFGTGFASACLTGSENNDGFYFSSKKVKCKTNNCGGVLGGMATGMPLVFSVALKPTPSIKKEQNSVDLATGENVKISTEGRHDPCIVKRALPAIMSATALAVFDTLGDR